MRKLIFVLSTICVVTFAAGTAAAQKCTSDDRTLIATFAGTHGQPPYNITSDGMGSYSNVKGKGINTEVMFQICNGTYDFTMNLNMSSRSMKVLLPGGTADSKFFNFDRVANIPVTLPSPAFSAFCGGENTDGTPFLNTTTSENYAGCGQDAGGYYVRRVVGFQLTSGRSLRFQNTPFGSGGTLAAGTSYIKVYHPSVSTWTIEVEDIPAAVNPKCGTNGSCGAIIYHPNKGPAFVESYVLGRFQITLTSSKAYN